MLDLGSWSDRANINHASVLLGLLGLLGAAALGCSSNDGASMGSDDGVTEITVASVDNPQMQNLFELLPEFHEANPDLHVDIIFLPENQLREEVTESVGAKSGRYDLMTIGTYEVPIWAKNGWLENLQPWADASDFYDPDDLLAGVSTALSLDSDLYAVPFYGESSMLMYRTDLLADAGVSLSESPTWDEVAAAARAVHDPDAGVSGICLRGRPGWGEQLAPLNTIVNTFGGRWYDMNWAPQLTSAEFSEAFAFYTGLIEDAGQPDAETFGFVECLKAYQTSRVAMWYDATVGASNFTGSIAENSGYAFAPTKSTEHSGWLWAWALAIPAGSDSAEAAWRFAAWATSKEYIRLVGAELGWNQVPPGTRASTYALEEYMDVAGDYANITLQSIEQADVNNATLLPVPYTGIQYLGIPEFTHLGTNVSLRFAEVLSGSLTAEAALGEAQTLAEEVGAQYRQSTPQ